ncbi:MAG: hypothetical protein EAX96_02240 [Candidatus Lokiarchaeota archaeon]|nr:hypothetical protein [Candidatus Lokiarchaeota archaeon]
MKLGTCPVCTEELDGNYEKKELILIKKGEKFDCYQCGSELFLDLIKERPRLGSEKAIILKYPTLTMGLEIESFSIDLNKMKFVSMAPIYPKDGIEREEEFKKDMTIGSEFNSPVFTSLNEAFFRLKTALRKYFVNLETDENMRIALIGSYDYENETAGVHYHFAFNKVKGITIEQAKHISPLIHQHIPFIIAITANSPIIRKKMTKIASNRLLNNGMAMFSPLTREDLEEIELTNHFNEINFAKGTEKKPSTLEIRVVDSTIPEYIMAGLFIAYISILGAIKGKKPWKYFKFSRHEKDRINAARRGVKAEIHWNKAKWVIPKYIDAFFNYYRTEVKESNINRDILNVFRLAKSWWNAADIVRESYRIIENRYKNKGQDFINQEFCRKLLEAQRRNLDGDNLISFARHLNVKIPSIENVKLGKYF